MRKERETYLLRARKLDMEMSPDTLEAVGINELFVAVGVDASTIVVSVGCSFRLILFDFLVQCLS